MHDVGLPPTPLPLPRSSLVAVVTCPFLLLSLSQPSLETRGGRRESNSAGKEEKQQSQQQATKPDGERKVSLCRTVNGEGWLGGLRRKGQSYWWMHGWICQGCPGCPAKWISFTTPLVDEQLFPPLFQTGLNRNVARSWSSFYILGSLQWEGAQLSGGLWAGNAFRRHVQQSSPYLLRGFQILMHVSPCRSVTIGFGYRKNVV